MRSWPHSGYTVMASHRYDDGLEPAPQHYPEVAAPQTHEYYAQQHHQYPEVYHDSPPTAKLTPSPYSPPPPLSGYGGGTTIAGSTVGSQAHVGDAHTRPKSDGKGRTICGCSLLTFVLSCIIAMLSAAVVGLAAGTGIEASRANDAVTKLAAYTSANPPITSTSSPGASTTATATSTGSIGSATSLSGVEIDSGCSSRLDKVNGTIYTSLKPLGELRYKIYCSSDYWRDPNKKNDLAAIFTPDFEGCMEACASWTRYVVPKGDSKDATWNCEAVSFIPDWTNRSVAKAGGASGNCYLKPGPVSLDKLGNNTLKMDVHAALWQSG